MFPPSKIAGTRIAYGRATWIVSEEDQKGHYTFVDEDSFTWTLNPGQLIDMKVDEEDLLDCVNQAEKQFGAPEEYRPALGLLPKSGAMNIGATFVSTTNPAITCVFTPTSLDHPTTSALAADYVAPDAYFEWYHNPETKPVDNMEAFLKEFDRLSGARTDNVIKSPIIVPSYEEASNRVANLMAPDLQEQFLQQVWSYHKVPMTHYLRESAKSQILETWNRVLRVERLAQVYEG